MSAVTIVDVVCKVPEWPFVLAKISMVSPTLVNLVVTNPSPLIVSWLIGELSLGAMSLATIGCAVIVIKIRISTKAFLRMVVVLLGIINNNWLIKLSPIKPPSQQPTLHWRLEYYRNHDSRSGFLPLYCHVI